MPDAANHVTLLLARIRQGDPGAQAELITLVYRQLRQLAEDAMRHERRDHTLQPTAVVNEAILRLLKQDAIKNADNRSIFFGMVARAMRQVLVDHARRRSAGKRGGGVKAQPLDEILEVMQQQQNVDLLALDEALDELAKLNTRQCDIVTQRFFAGFEIRQIAENLGLSKTTIENDFRAARAFLRGQLGQLG